MVERIGSSELEWRRSFGHGYLNIYQPSHSSADGRGYVHEHRYVMEQHLVRILKADEVVDHIKGNK